MEGDSLGAQKRWEHWHLGDDRRFSGLHPFFMVLSPPHEQLADSYGFTSAASLTYTNLPAPKAIPLFQALIVFHLNNCR